MDQGKQAATEPRRTWNTPEAIGRHRQLSPGERVKLAVEVSRMALKFAHAGRPDGR